MAAYQQAKRMQRGVKLGYNEVPTLSATTKFVTPTIAIGSDDFSIEYWGNAYGSGSQSIPILFNSKNFNSSSSANFFSVYGIGLSENNISWVRFSSTSGGDTLGDSLSFKYSAPTLDAKFHLVITRSGKAIRVYIDNVLIASKEQTEIKDMGEFVLGIANSSDVGFVRVWNMCLSADDVTAHYNNGDPMGYVVPKVYRQFGPSIEPKADTFEFNIGSPYSQTVSAAQNYPFGCIYRMKYVVDEWDYQPSTVSQVGFGGINGYSFISGVANWYKSESAKVGEEQTMIFTMTGTSAQLLLYGGQDGTETTSRHLKVTINEITPIGLLAEYLPQNLMESRKYKFPLDSFTQSANTFSCSASTTNKVYDNPQANGFSGEFMRFEAITDITLTCSFYIDVVQRAYPIRVTAEYRSNADLIGGFSSGPVVMSKNEGEASIVSFDIPNGISNSEYIRCADNPEAWLEMRILSIEPIPNMATSWLDSAKQLPLSDEYMEPLFQSIGGYDMAANGAPEILYNE